MDHRRWAELGVSCWLHIFRSPYLWILSLACIQLLQLGSVESSGMAHGHHISRSVSQPFKHLTYMSHQLQLQFIAWRKGNCGYSVGLRWIMKFGDWIPSLKSIGCPCHWPDPCTQKSCVYCYANMRWNFEDYFLLLDIHIHITGTITTRTLWSGPRCPMLVVAHDYECLFLFLRCMSNCILGIVVTASGHGNRDSVVLQRIQRGAYGQ